MTDDELKAIEAGLGKAKERHGDHPMITDMGRLIAAVRKQAADIETLVESRRWAMGKVGSLEETLDDINDILTVPAAEYVPAIGDVFKRIDEERGHD